jgi:predicted nucleotidyltransferase
MPADHVETTLRDFFRHRSDFVTVYLFGSQARGDARPDSGVDLGLLYATPPETTLLGQPYELEGELSRRLGHNVTCTILNTAPPDLVHRVLRDGIIVAETDKPRRIAFEVKLRNEYFDLLPRLHEYRKLSPA